LDAYFSESLGLINLPGSQPVGLYGIPELLQPVAVRGDHERSASGARGGRGGNRTGSGRGRGGPPAGQPTVVAAFNTAAERVAAARSAAAAASRARQQQLN